MSAKRSSEHSAFRAFIEVMIGLALLFMAAPGIITLAVFLYAYFQSVG